MIILNTTVSQQVGDPVRYIIIVSTWFIKQERATIAGIL
jgi:hypothetical protein